MRIAVCVIAISCLAISTADAEKNATLETIIAELGSPVVNVTFETAMPPECKGAKGEWKVDDGVLVGKELAADNHAAVLNFNKQNRDSVVRFSFKLDGTTEGLHFSLNHSGGHLCRVIVTPAQMTLNLDKDKKDPNSKAQVLARAKGDFSQGTWHTMQVEIVGDQIACQVDNGTMVKASHAKLNTEKPNYRLVMRGDSLSIDDLRIWDVK